MATCAVSGTLVDSTETAISGATIRFNIVTPYANSSTTNFFMPTEVSTTSSGTGTWTLNLSRNISGIITIDFPPNSMDSTRKATFAVVIPNTSTATFISLVTET